MENVLERQGIAYKVNAGDGAFYGPKIDFHILDSLGRSWQCGTVQLDFQMPEKFGCSYIDQQNSRKQPIMIHRAIYGSIERFMAILIEHYAGDFPFWLAPVQASILSISDAHAEYAKAVGEYLQKAGYRVSVDDRSEKIGLKIREGSQQKVPYLLIVGDKEMQDKTVAVRKRPEGNIGEMSLGDLLKQFEA